MKIFELEINILRIQFLEAFSDKNYVSSLKNSTVQFNIVIL